MALPLADWYSVRRATNRKPVSYVCPFCGRRLQSMTEHVLVVPEDDASRRRHAHTQCAVRARQAGRLPTRSEWRAKQRADSGRPGLVARLLRRG